MVDAVNVHGYTIELIMQSTSVYRVIRHDERKFDKERKGKCNQKYSKNVMISMLIRQKTINIIDNICN